MKITIMIIMIIRNITIMVLIHFRVRIIFEIMKTLKVMIMIHVAYIFMTIIITYMIAVIEVMA